MIHINGLIPTLEKKLAGLPEGHSLDVRTFKRDRQVIVTKLPGDRLRVIENGFERKRFETDLNGLRRLMKTLTRRDFPRSSRLRLYTLNPTETDSLIRPMEAP
jgi:hypothetical protein